MPTHAPTACMSFLWGAWRIRRLGVIESTEPRVLPRLTSRAQGYHIKSMAHATILEIVLLNKFESTFLSELCHIARGQMQIFQI